MQSFIVKTYGGVLVLAAFGCSGAAQEPKPASEQGRAPEPQSGEWLYATQRAGSGQKAECAAVHDWVMGERNCKQALCAHGARLGADWLRICKSVQPDKATDIETTTAELRTRAGGAATPCEAEGGTFVRGACTEGETCIERAQNWATRCSGEATPLVMRIIEVRLERMLGNGVRLDSRGCETMFADVRKAADCTQTFQCADALDTVEQYRARCRARGLATLEQAVTELTIFAGAERAGDPIAVEPSSKLTQEQHPLALADGSGAILSVCGERTANLAAYLEKRKSCDGDAVTLVRRIVTERGAEARLGTMPHPGDVLFRLRFPSIVAHGELRARDQADLATFQRAIDELVRAPLNGAANAERAIGALVKTMNLHLDGVQNSALFEQELKQRDESLVSVFRALGKAKNEKIVARLPPGRFLAALNRAGRLPFADVALDGRVAPGESTPAAVVDFVSMLPKATAAYRAQLASRYELARTIRAPKTLYTDTLERLGTHARACAEAEATYGACEAELLSCAFAVKPCDAAQVETKGSSCDTARVRAEREHLQARLALDTLSDEHHKAGVQAFANAGCRQPWW